MRIDEKDRRVYYQTIVYDVCNLLDKCFNRRTVCGTIEEPTEEVQKRLAEIVNELLETREDPLLCTCPHEEEEVKNLELDSDEERSRKKKELAVYAKAYGRLS